MQEEPFKEAVDKTRAEFAAKISELTEANVLAQKEKEVIAMRYAFSEKDVIMLKKAREQLEKKLHDASRQCGALSNKVKNVTAEKKMVTAILNNKGAELTKVKKEQKRLQEELYAKDVKLKWVQDQLKTEAYTYSNYLTLQEEVEALKKKYKLSCVENDALTARIRILEQERVDRDEFVSRLKETQNSLRQRTVDLASKLTAMENLQLLLNKEQEIVDSQKDHFLLNMATSSSQMDDMNEELLALPEDVPAKSTDCSFLEAERRNSEIDIYMLSQKGDHVEEQKVEQLGMEKEMRQELAQKLSEAAKAVEILHNKLKETEVEGRVLKQRHIASVLELTRELQYAMQKIRKLELQQHRCRMQEPIRKHQFATVSALLNRSDNEPALTSFEIEFSHTKGLFNNKLCIIL